MTKLEIMKGPPKKGIMTATSEQVVVSKEFVEAAKELMEASKRCRAELSAMHSYHYNSCDGGCPADVFEQKLVSAITRAEKALEVCNENLQRNFVRVSNIESV